MSPNATNIEQEGIYIEQLQPVDRGRFGRELTTSSPRPNFGTQPGADNQ